MVVLFLFHAKVARSFVGGVAVATLAACASNGYQPSSFTLVVEGNEASYAAFEAAAKACGYTAYRRFLGGAAARTITVGPHYNLSRVGTAPARCAITWVDQHPETGLLVSGE